ncbi:hypothetical protein TrVFT333_001201 [Trichoderma virens FT-333]|nr:hypothetical protein TrVFT333_001201 [Trichoderma virens FT-333]
MSSAGKRSLRLPSSPTQGQAKRRRSAASNSLAAGFGSANGEASSSSSQLGMNIPESTLFDPASAYHSLPQRSVEATGPAPTPIISMSAPQTSSRTQTNRQRTSSLRMGGCSLDEMLLSIPQGLASAEHARRKDALQHEISFQERNPPILPPSQVQDLPPKPFIADFLKFPDGISDLERLQIETRNNEIAAEHQKIDRQRNNQAAKKSRQARLEALNNTRVLLNEKTAECAWFRMKTRLVKEIDGRVKVVEGEIADVKKREEAKKRADRNKRRAEARKDEEEQHLQSSQ